LSRRNCSAVFSLGLGPQRINDVVRSQRAADEFLIEGPDGNGAEEGRGGGRGAAGLLYFGRIEQVGPTAGRSVTGQADSVGGLFAHRADEAGGLAWHQPKRVDMPCKARW
jgi:hypothetical protein